MAVADTIYMYEEMRERYSMRKRERERGDKHALREIKD